MDIRLPLELEWDALRLDGNRAARCVRERGSEVPMIPCAVICYSEAWRDRLADEPEGQIQVVSDRRSGVAGVAGDAANPVSTIQTVYQECKLASVVLYAMGSDEAAARLDAGAPTLRAQDWASRETMKAVKVIASLGGEKESCGEIGGLSNQETPEI